MKFFNFILFLVPMLVAAATVKEDLPIAEGIYTLSKGDPKYCGGEKVTVKLDQEGDKAAILLGERLRFVRVNEKQFEEPVDPEGCQYKVSHDVKPNYMTEQVSYRCKDGTRHKQLTTLTVTKEKLTVNISSQLNDESSKIQRCVFVKLKEGAGKQERGTK